MRWHILRTLLYKEALRHLANRGGIVLAVLLVGISMLLSLWKEGGSQGPLLGGEVPLCYLVYNQSDDYRDAIHQWLTTLKQQAPPERRNQIKVKAAEKFTIDPTTRNILPDKNAGMIRVYSNGPGRFRVDIWYPGENPLPVAGYEAWFWQETRRYFGGEPDIDATHHRLRGSPDLNSLLATALVIFAMFITCVYLLSSMTCEERERGVLMAQALSPASALEILAAKFLFYPVAGMALGAVLAGVYRPGTLVDGFFWMSLLVTSLGSLGIGMTIATLAKTQRLATVGTMCYLVVLALLFMTIQQNQIPYVSYLIFEFHTLHILHGAIANALNILHWLHLAGAALLALSWVTLATVLFRRRGWQ